MATKKILIATGIFPPDIGGPATYTKLLLDKLPQDFLIKVLTYGEAQIGDAGRIFRVSRKLPKGLRHFIYFIKVIRLGLGADIIFAQDPVSAGLPALLAAKILRKKFVLKIVGDYAWEQGVQRFNVKDSIEDFQVKKYGRFVENLRRIQSWVARKADLIIVPSNYLGRSVVQKWGVDKNKIFVIYNGTDIPKLDFTKAEARADLGFSGKVLVSVGRLVPWKGFEMLIEVIAELRGSMKEFKLFIIGDGPDRNKLGVLAEKLGVGNGVIFTGALSRLEMFKHVRAADVFVLNSGYEGFSHLLIEVLGLGTPIMASGAGGNAEILSGDNSEIFNYNDKERFKKQLTYLIENPARTDVLIKNGLARAKEFSESAMIKKISGILIKL